VRGISDKEHFVTGKAGSEISTPVLLLPYSAKLVPVNDCFITVIVEPDMRKARLREFQTSKQW
jgi:hypothetical protein